MAGGQRAVRFAVVLAVLLASGSRTHAQTAVSLSDLYDGSYALLVGASTYDARKWAALPRIPKEVDRLAAALESQGFAVTKLVGQVESRAIREAIDKFIGEYGYRQRARIVIFFAGHGFTRHEGQVGYVVPSDAPHPTDGEQPFLAKAIPIQQFDAWARQMEARHVLFLFDSCFAGTIFQTRGESRPLARNLAEPVREFLTAGRADETVPAESVFVPALIRGLAGEADTDRDRLITGSELFAWLQAQPFDERQTPQFGKIRHPELDRGDIVFASESSVTVSPAPAAPPTSVSSQRARSRNAFFGWYGGRGWIENDGQTYDWEIRPMESGVFVRAALVQTSDPKQTRRFQEMVCSWILGEADEFQCYRLPGRKHVTPRNPEDESEANTITLFLGLHPEGLLVRQAEGRGLMTAFLFHRIPGR